MAMTNAFTFTDDEIETILSALSMANAEAGRAIADADMDTPARIILSMEQGIREREALINKLEEVEPPEEGR